MVSLPLRFIFDWHRFKIPFYTIEAGIRTASNTKALFERRLALHSVFGLQAPQKTQELCYNVLRKTNRIWAGKQEISLCLCMYAVFTMVTQMYLYYIHTYIILQANFVFRNVFPILKHYK